MLHTEYLTRDSRSGGVSDLGSTLTSLASLHYSFHLLIFLHRFLIHRYPHTHAYSYIFLFQVYSFETFRGDIRAVIKRGGQKRMACGGMIDPDELVRARCGKKVTWLEMWARACPIKLQALPISMGPRLLQCGLKNLASSQLSSPFKQHLAKRDISKNRSSATSSIWQPTSRSCFSHSCDRSARTCTP
jgi:hypothetical protein